VDEDLTVRISSLEHFTYCPRQCALIDVEGQWVDNEHVVRGQWQHRRADSGEHRQERGRQVLRSIPLWSEKWGLTGRADVVEVTGESVVPVEYKAGVRHGRAADIQLCAEALCLEEMFGREVPLGYVWYRGPRRRQPVRIDRLLRVDTVEAINAIRSMIERGTTPPPAADERCEQCQLQARCLPTTVDKAGRALKILATIFEGD
jgi:CRISPR-associated exonuclease Cas4